MDTRIKDVKGYQILDSRGTPTLTVEVELNCGIKGMASVPSGASVGKNEAVELRDNDNSFYFGKSVQKAVQNVNEPIARLVKGICAFSQKEIDDIMIEADGTENKENLGANAILGVSLAVCKAACHAIKLPLYKYLGGMSANILPTPMINILNGGVHADNSLDFQEFMISPVGAQSFSYAMQMGAEIFYSLKKVLKDKGYNTSVGDEGGFAPDIKTNAEALDLIIESINNAGYTTDDVNICLDAASSEFYEDGKYHIKGENKILTRDEMAQYLTHLTQDYPIISIEDAMAQNDYSGWQIITQALGDKILLVGDDVFVTNSNLLLEGIRDNIANSILIKPNQIGTLSETLDTIELAKSANYKPIISHRSGETEDTFIADLSVAIGGGLIKTGSISRAERTCKYNRLLKIENELAGNAKYMGAVGFSPRYLKKGCNCTSRCNLGG